MQINPLRQNMLSRGNMENIIIIAIVLAIVISIIYYLYKEKKKGTGCIGCPYAKKCGGKCGGKTEE